MDGERVWRVYQLTSSSSDNAGRGSHTAWVKVRVQVFSPNYLWMNLGWYRIRLIPKDSH
jgi:hypothetical protein